MTSACCDGPTAFIVIPGVGAIPVIQHRQNCIIVILHRLEMAESVALYLLYSAEPPPPGTMLSSPTVFVTAGRVTTTLAEVSASLWPVQRSDARTAIMAAIADGCCPRPSFEKKYGIKRTTLARYCLSWVATQVICALPLKLDHMAWLLRNRGRNRR